MTPTDLASPVPAAAPVRETTMVVLENVGTCNMRCTYCFPEHMWQREGRHGTMTEQTYRGILERVFETSSDTVDVHLAGGEPLLAGQAWLTMAFRVAREIAARQGKSVTFSLQTNATQMTPELAQWFTDNEANVGVSLDGPPDINEAVRGHTDDTLAGLDCLSDAAGGRPGVIVTVTRANARRMHEVVDYLEHLGVATFRANQMGATAEWSVDAAPRAEEWAAARRTIFEEMVARRGRIMEVNVSSAVTKLVGTLLHGMSPFGAEHRCCGMRCPAGRQLMYFDRAGNSWPCPRANVTPSARVAHWADDDFDERWAGAARALDAAMAVPPECARCPAQLACDFGCHAFNVAEGNFFEVNCDASKELHRWALGRLEDVSRIQLLVDWRQELTAQDPAAARRAVAAGIDLPEAEVKARAAEVAARLGEWLARPDLDATTLDRRYGWRDDRVPAAAAPLRGRRLPLVISPRPNDGGGKG